MSIFNIFNFSKTSYKKYISQLKYINSLEKEFIKKTDAELKQETAFLKNLYQKEGFSKKVCGRAFANVIEGAKRSISKKYYDVQIIGGLVLHDGKITEMKTGEGKTFVASLAAYLNAISGEPVHIITVNDYLARRDSEILRPLYEFLDLSVGCVIDGLDHNQKQEEYAKSVVYVTNNEVGFDYLRDNMVTSFDNTTIIKRGMSYAIIDEADSILIDESRTPLIISGPSLKNIDIYKKINSIVAKLDEVDYEVDEKYKSAQLTENGIIKIELMLKAANIIQQTSTLHEVENVSIINNIIQAIKANYIFKKDVDYIIKDKKVVLIDEFTGRTMDDRRYSDGLHQAIEAKEKVEIQNENQTLASITYQNLFRMYNKLSGMTGTALTEEKELRSIYSLPVICVPTNKPCKRKDFNDVVFAKKDFKFKKIVELVKDCYERGQPALIGTISIENSELLSNLLKKEKIVHNVLNAKHHEQEAQIISQAGRFKAVTIATNMAGRGTDIKLGGNIDFKIQDLLKEGQTAEEIEQIKQQVAAQHEQEQTDVIKAGGLFVIGSERHESRRIDDQLIGRCARQGDPGCSKFFLSLEDDLLRLFGGERIEKVLKMFGFKEEEALDAKMLNNVIRKSQKRIENIHYEMRKNLLQYDNIMSEQREQVYKDRLDILKSKSILTDLTTMIESFNEEAVEKHLNDMTDENQEEKIIKYFSNIYGEKITYSHDGTILEAINNYAHKMIKNKVKMFDASFHKLEEVTKYIMLKSLDEAWKKHLYSITHLKESVNFRSFAQKNPIHEYKIESFTLFEEMIHEFLEATVFNMSRVQIVSNLEG